MQVYLSGAWHNVDATTEAVRPALIPIAVGRDAADVAMTTLWGIGRVREQTVDVRKISGCIILHRGAVNCTRCELMNSGEHPQPWRDWRSHNSGQVACDFPRSLATLHEVNRRTLCLEGAPRANWF